MVSVAQWLRRQVVALEIVGSNPTVHPFSYSSADKSTGLRRMSQTRRPIWSEMVTVAVPTPQPTMRHS